MTLREKAGLMLIDTLNAQCVDGNRGALGASAHDYLDSQQMRRFVFRNTVATPSQAVCAPPDQGFQQVVEEVGDPDKVVLHVYFRQPFVLDEASGLRDSGAIVAGFGITDRTLMEVLSGRFEPQGRMPFALAGTRAAVEQQFSDLPGYEETADGALFPFGHGLRYE